MFRTLLVSVHIQGLVQLIERLCASFRLTSDEWMEVNTTVCVKAGFIVSAMAGCPEA